MRLGRKALFDFCLLVILSCQVAAYATLVLGTVAFLRVECNQNTAVCENVFVHNGDV